ncbi:MAG: hypothetical protein R3296_08045 [Oleiphilaceae bacterium]|nr:hypothetical protein [Oleiphilaceae bacterium]
MGLRTFWRKYQSLQYRDNSGPPPAAAASLYEQLNEAGQYHLERLRKLLWLRYEQNFPGDDDATVHAMIHYAARKRDQDIQRELLLLYLNCSPSVQELLRSGGITHSLEDHD